MDFVEFYVVLMVYGFLGLAIVSPMAWGLMALDKHTPAPDPVVVALLLPVLALYVAVAWWAWLAAGHKVKGERLFQAAGSALAEQRVALSFLPVVGRYFAARDRDVDDASE
jgi:hypothetical protein